MAEAGANCAIVSYEPPKEYLTAEQQDGEKLCSAQVYEETMQWLIEQGCERLIPAQLVQDYAQATARHIQSEKYLSEYGLIAKHPTTGEPTVSPFHKMNIESQKLAVQLWSQIYAVVKTHAERIYLW